MEYGRVLASDLTFKVDQCGQTSVMREAALRAVVLGQRMPQRCGKLIRFSCSGVRG
jgi:hypothetical protein